MKVVVTDLDGTLLDQDTYDWEPARFALERLRALGIPLVFCTTKTRAEVEHWRTITGNAHPFIVENGGAMYIPLGYFPFSVPFARQSEPYEMVQFGEDHAVLIQALREAAAESQSTVRTFDDMTPEEISSLCNLPLGQAMLAKRREFDVAFELLSGNAEALLEAIERTGKKWTRGGRFYHVTGQNDKALAVMTLLRLYYQIHREVFSVGLGDSPGDLEFLKVVDRAVIIQSPASAALKSILPNALMTSEPGPAGWGHAVLQMVP
jgi:mannosyl-3-phosphoglycerate phosphatase